MASSNPLHAWREIRRLPRPVWVSVAAALVNRLGTMALPFLTLYLTRERRMPVTEAGLVLSLYGVMALIAAPISGRLCDRFGPTPVMRISFIATGFTVAVVPWVHGKLAVCVAVALWSFCNETFRPANMAHLGSCVLPEQRKPAYALNRWAVNVGMSIGPAVGGLLAAHSFPSIFVVDGATSIVAGLIIAFFMPALAAPARTSAPRSGLPFEALGDPRFVAALLGLLPLAALFFQIDSTLSLTVVAHLKLDPALFGLLATVNTVLIVLVEIPLNHATARWSHRRTMVTGALLTALGLGAMGLARGFGALAAFTVVWTVGEMLASPGLSAHIAELSPPDRRGEYMGLYVMTWSVAFIVAPWLGTQLLAHFGPAITWPILGSLGLCSALIYARPGRRERPEPQLGRSAA